MKPMWCRNRKLLKARKCKRKKKEVGQRHKRQKAKSKKQNIDKEVILIAGISFLNVTKVTKKVFSK